VQHVGIIFTTPEAIIFASNLPQFGRNIVKSLRRRTAIAINFGRVGAKVVQNSLQICFCLSCISGSITENEK